MEYNQIKTPEELLEFMDKNFSYGYLGKSGKVHYYSDNDFNDVWYSEYVLENTKDILNTKVGNCYDQVEFERDWFIKNGYVVKTYYEIIDLDYENDYPSHSFLVFKDKYWSWFEYSDFNNRGIHRFDSLEELLDYQKNKYIGYLKEFNINDNELKKLVFKEFNKPKEHIGAKEYIEFVMK